MGDGEVVPSGIRLAQATDADAVAGLVRAAYAHYVERIGREPGPMGEDYAAAIARGSVWLLESGGALVGVAVIEDANGRFLLDNVAVSPLAQGRGHGRVLMAFTEWEARARGFDAVHLYTHVLMHENIALYSRLGYVETGRISEKGFDRVYMAKALTGHASTENSPTAASTD